MSAHQKSILAFSKLGQLFRDYSEGNSRSDNWIQLLDNECVEASSQNKWFTKDNLSFCIAVWGETLTKEAITAWLSNYNTPTNTKRLGLVLAGNVPMVGLHDLLCGLACGYSIQAKRSSNDTVLLPFIVDFLVDTEPSWKDSIQFTDGKLSNFDAVIATGSNNTARYFEYYFKDVPHIIRKTRNGVALLDGTETSDDLAALSTDIVHYFGLGCRSVSHLIVPENYDFNTLFLALYEHRDIIHHNAYANNYDYNKAVYLMQELDLLDNGFMMLKKDTGLNSPIACVHYSTYATLEEAKNRLNEEAQQIQCVVSNVLSDALPFGSTQYPKLMDYADHVDTMAFLLKN